MVRREKKILGNVQAARKAAEFLSLKTWIGPRGNSIGVVRRGGASRCSSPSIKHIRDPVEDPSNRSFPRILPELHGDVLSFRANLDSPLPPRSYEKAFDPGTTCVPLNREEETMVEYLLATKTTRVEHGDTDNGSEASGDETDSIVANAETSDKSPAEPCSPRCSSRICPESIGVGDIVKNADRYHFVIVDILRGAEGSVQLLKAYGCTTLTHIKEVSEERIKTSYLLMEGGENNFFDSIGQDKDTGKKVKVFSKKGPQLRLQGGEKMPRETYVNTTSTKIIWPHGLEYVNGKHLTLNQASLQEVRKCLNDRNKDGREMPTAGVPVRPTGNTHNEKKSSTRCGTERSRVTIPSCLAYGGSGLESAD